MDENHQHEYKTRFVTIKQVDCVSGMECNCGRMLTLDEAEEAFSIYAQSRLPSRRSS